MEYGRDLDGGRRGILQGMTSKRAWATSGIEGEDVVLYGGRCRRYTYLAHWDNETSATRSR